MPTIAIGSSVAWAADRDRLGAAPLAVASRQQVVGERGGGRVVEDEGRRQAQAGGGAEAVAQLDRGERVEAELLEGAVGLDRRGGGVAEHRGDLGADQLQDERLALGLGQRGEPGGQRAGGAARRSGRADEAAEERRQGAGGGLRRAGAARSKRPAPGGGALGAERRRRRAPGPARSEIGAMPRARASAPGRPRSSSRGHAALAAPTGPRRARWRAGLRRGAAGRARRGRRWRRRSCPGRGRRAVPGAEEKRTKAERSSSAVSSCRCQAASTLAAKTRSSRSASSDSTCRRRGRRRSGSRRRGGARGDRVEAALPSCSRSETSQAAIVDLGAELLQLGRSSSAPSASGPQRLTRSRWRAPWASTRWRAKRAPRPPVAPVIRTVRSGSIGGRLGVLGAGAGAGGQPRHQRLALAQGELGLLARQRRARRAAPRRRPRCRRCRSGRSGRGARMGGADQAPERRGGGVGRLRLAGRDRALGEDDQARVLGVGSSASQSWQRLQGGGAAPCAALGGDRRARGRAAGSARALSPARLGRLPRRARASLPVEAEEALRRRWRALQLARDRPGEPTSEPTAATGVPPASKTVEARSPRLVEVSRTRSVAGAAGVQGDLAARRRAAPALQRAVSHRQERDRRAGRRRAAPGGARSAPASSACSSARRDLGVDLLAVAARPRSGPGRRGRTRSPASARRS